MHSLLVGREEDKEYLLYPEGCSEETKEALRTKTIVYEVEVLDWTVRAGMFTLHVPNFLHFVDLLGDSTMMKTVQTEGVQNSDRPNLAEEIKSKS